MREDKTLSVRREPVRGSNRGVIRLASLAGAVLVLAAALAAPAFAEDNSFAISIKDHRFEPETITVPAGKQVKLVVTNMDPTPEEFESHELNREKIIAGGSTAVILIGPLEPGTYPFFGEFHEDTAQGRIVVE
jgi:plastocyanin